MSEDFSDLPAVIESVAEPVTLVTLAMGVLGSDGFWRNGAESTATINVVSWPTTGRESQQVPEGVRSRELRTFISSVELRGAKGGESLPAQRIRGYLGADWEVQICKPWNVGGFWESVAVRVGQ
jgi:hypothetical protein